MRKERRAGRLRLQVSYCQVNMGVVVAGHGQDRGARRRTQGTTWLSKLSVAPSSEQPWETGLQSGETVLAEAGGVDAWVAESLMQAASGSAPDCWTRPASFAFSWSARQVPGRQSWLLLRGGSQLSRLLRQSSSERPGWRRLDALRTE